uniref:Uncharacterized protein n=1 Tax=Panagrolaimus davidi TaxID=227884 RepID=A0A914PF27_9BILA
MQIINYSHSPRQEYPQNTQTGKRVAEVAEIEISHTDGDNLNAAGYNTDFRIYSSKHIAVYYQKILPAIFANRQSYERKKVLNEYHKQICSFLSVARKLSSMLTSSSNLIRTSIMDIILEIAEKHDIGDKNAAVDFWKGVQEIIAHSNCDDQWITIFNNLVHFSVCLVTGQTDDPSVYKSLKPDSAPQFYVAT